MPQYIGCEFDTIGDLADYLNLLQEDYLLLHVDYGFYQKNRGVSTVHAMLLVEKREADFNIRIRQTVELTPHFNSDNRDEFPLEWEGYNKDKKTHKFDGVYEGS